MAITETHNLVLSKMQKRAVGEPKLQKQLDTALSIANSRARELQGFITEPGLVDGQSWKIEGSPKDGYTFEMYLTLTYSRHDDTPPNQNTFSTIYNGLNSGMASGANGLWQLTQVDDQEFTPYDPDATVISKDFIGYSPVQVPENFEEYFSHLYGLDDAIAMLKDVLQAAIDSDWESRFNVALIGAPGCGKTEIARAFKRAIGGDEACMEFDSTATTGAGAIKELADTEVLPRCIIFEEMEKSNDQNLNFTLSVTDTRGEIRKTTARKTVQRDVKLLAVATVNDEDAFDKLNKGALGSRFMHRIYFHEPDREMLRMILQREVDKIRGGSEAWIDPTLDYCDKHGITSPRKVIALCITGRDKWLDVRDGMSTFERQLAKTSKQAEVVPSEEW